jgi:starch synthase
MGLDGLINMRSSDLHGIVNGIDTDIWDPETDPHLVPPIHREHAEEPRPTAAVEEFFGLDRDDARSSASSAA